MDYLDTWRVLDALEIFPAINMGTGLAVGGLWNPAVVVTLPDPLRWGKYEKIHLSMYYSDHDDIDVKL